MPAKICILTTVHPPFDTRIFHKQAKTLVQAGYDVTLIAQHDKNEVADGVKIIALPRPRNRLQRMFKLTWEGAPGLDLHFWCVPDLRLLAPAQYFTPYYVDDEWCDVGTPTPLGHASCRNRLQRGNWSFKEATAPNASEEPLSEGGKQ